MNQLIYNFLNEIEDANKLNEISLEEFIKLVKSNSMISEDDAKQLIESFKKIISKKSDEEDANDSEQRKKKYRIQHQGGKQEIINKIEEPTKERDEDNSIER